MGMYYGVKNYTKGHNVGSYWKGSPPSPEEVKEMFSRYKWDSTDKVYAICYCNSYIWSNKDNDWMEEEESEESEESHNEESKEWVSFNFDNPDKPFDGTFFCN